MLPFSKPTYIRISSTKITVCQDIFERHEREVRNDAQMGTDGDQETTMDEDLNSLLDFHNHAEEIRVIMTDEPKIEITDNMATSMQTDQMPKTPRKRRQPKATATRETERGSLYPDPPLPISPINPYHEDLTDDEDGPAAHMAGFQANPWPQ